jgi:pterin-4a-carbinolamine dehydratase
MPTDKHIEHNILLNYLGDWEEFQEDNILKLRKTYCNHSYKEGLNNIQKIGELSETLNHHPLMHLEYKSLTVVWWSHDVSGISHRDFRSAGATDNIINSSSFNGDFFKLPSEKYVPGQNKKPAHQMEYYHILKTEQIPDAKNVSLHPSFLCALRLFNNGYYWETHEVLEDLWNKAGRKNELAQIFQSFIFLAAGNLKRLIGNNKSSQRHYQSAINKMPKCCIDLISLDYDKYINQIKKHLNSDDVINITFS